MSTTEVSNPSPPWHYMPLVHYRRIQGRHTLTLRDADDRPIRTVVSPEHVPALRPYLALYELERNDPWSNAPAYIPVELDGGCWRFSLAGATFDATKSTSSEAERGCTGPYSRPTFA